MFKTFWSLQAVMVGWTVVVLSHLAMENTDANEWQVISELPTHRRYFSTAVVEGKIYLIGGTLFANDRDGPFGMSLVEVYDPQTNTWQRLADMPTARTGSRAAVVAGKIYVLAGKASKDNQAVNFRTWKVVEMYDPQTDTWVRKQDMSRRRASFGIGVVAGKIYAIGGNVHPGDRKPEDPRRVDLVEVYDPATNTWAKRADMPTRRTGVKAAVIRDTLYAIGGSGWPPDGQGGPALATIEAYHPKTNRWRKKPDMPNLRWLFSTVVVDDKIYLIGGTDGPLLWQRSTATFMFLVAKTKIGNFLQSLKSLIPVFVMSRHVENFPRAGVNSKQNTTDNLKEINNCYNPKF